MSKLKKKYDATITLAKTIHNKKLYSLKRRKEYEWEGTEVEQRMSNLFRARDYQKMLSAVENFLEVHPTCCMMLKLKADLLRRTGQLENVEEILRKAYDLSAINSWQRADIGIALGQYYLFHFRLEDALKHLTESERILEEIPGKYSRYGYCLNCIAKVYREKGKLESAEFYCKKSIPVFQFAQDFYKQAYSYRLLARIEIPKFHDCSPKVRKYSKYYGEYCILLASIIEQLPWYSNDYVQDSVEAKTAMYRGEFLFAIGDLVNARKDLRSSLELAITQSKKTNKKNPTMCRVYRKLADIDVIDNNAKEAIQNFLEAKNVL
ncbi:MAG: hypothetical protein Q8M03_01175, partial [Legionella sp.]|nr:hypothetical protein [Legionella sp.]